MDLYGLTIIDDDPELPELSFRIKSKQKVLDLTAQTEEEKSEWVTAIRGCVDDTENKRGVYIIFRFIFLQLPCYTNGNLT